MSVHELKTGRSAPANVVATLERVLAEARAGGVLSVAYIVVTPGGNVGSGFETSLDLNHAHHLVAGVEYLREMLVANARSE